ncbi:MAG: PAC2 family protein [Acidimicrobiia bacterium]|jgi:proteasome assembly chaperone (PAC2) family protein|nr:PAC2 family protein [Acidimicrobiia bacterium]
MDPIRRLGRPALRHPRALLAWEGWNDASDAASGALAYLLGQFELEPFVVIEPEEFYDFQVHRPRVKVAEGGTRRLTWPATRFYAVELPEQPGDLVIVTGDEPNLRWKTYSRLVAQVLSDVDVEAVATLGAFIGEVAHTVPVPLIGVATDPALLAAHRLSASGYEGPTGIVAVFLEACREIGVPALSLWAAVPHYLAANPNPRAMLALLTRAGEVLGASFDTAELQKVAEEFQERVDAAMAENETFQTYVRRLEAEARSEVRPGLDPRGGDRLISEIEEFLKGRRG